MKRLISLLIGCLSTLAFAQTPSAPISGMAVNQQGQPIPNAQIRVCLVSSTGIPCTPTATIYQDFALTNPIANPTTADQYGNYLVYVGTGSPNTYVIQVSADQGLTWTYVQNGPPSLGTVTSIGLTMPSSIFAVAGSPVTTNGVFNVTMQPQSANTFLAGPLSGSPAASAFRVIGSADLPLATTSLAGAVKPDNSTIGVSGSGVLSVIGGAAGVSEIIPGANVSCTPLVSGHCVGAVTVNSSGGGGGGGVNLGVQGNVAVYSTTTTVGGTSAISALSDSTQTNPTFGVLTYAGLGGSTFTTNAGGNFLFSSNNGSATFTNAVSQFTVTSIVSASAAPSQNPGQISLTTLDSFGSNESANINLSAQENGSVVGSGNIGLTATGGASSTQSGNINIASNGSGVDNLSGNLNLTASSGSITPGIGGGNVNIVTNGQIGASPTANVTAISLTANGGFSPIVLSGSNWQVDITGDMSIGGTFQATSLGTSPGCLFSNSSGVVASTGSACGSGGGGGIGGSGTAGSYALFSASTTLGNGHLTDSGSLITSTLPLLISDSSGTGGALTGVFGTAPTASSSVDTLWAGSAGFWQVNNANTGVATLMAMSSAGTPGHCLQVGTNGFYGVDSGAVCAGGGSSFTPTRVIDSGAGTGATITFVTGANDNTGWINITTGTSPTASAGVTTIDFGGTYSNIRKCLVEPSNSVTSALSGAAAMFVPQATASTTNFVIQANTTALAASTAYQVLYTCGT